MWILVLGKDAQPSDGIAYEDEKLADATRKVCQERWPERGPWRRVVVSENEELRALLSGIERQVGAPGPGQTLVDVVADAVAPGPPGVPPEIARLREQAAADRRELKLWILGYLRGALSLDDSILRERIEELRDKLSVP